MSDRDHLAEIIQNAMHVDALKGPEKLEELQRADLIIGVDITTGEHDLFFGKHALKRIMDSSEQEALAVFAFKYDSGTSELDFFCDKVKEVKGCCDFRGGSKRPPSSAAKVRVHNLESGTTQEIPASELAPGYVLAILPGVEGPVYVKPKLEERPVHKGLSEECQRVIRHYAEATKEVDLRTFDQHYAGFCREADPRRELIVHFHIAYVYRHFAEHKIISQEGRRSLFHVILQCSLSEAHTALEIMDLSRLSLTRHKVQEIVDYFHSCDWFIEFRRLFNPETMMVIGM